MARRGSGPSSAGLGVQQRLGRVQGPGVTDTAASSEHTHNAPRAHTPCPSYRARNPPRARLPLTSAMCPAGPSGFCQCWLDKMGGGSLSALRCTHCAAQRRPQSRAALGQANCMAMGGGRAADVPVPAARPATPDPQSNTRPPVPAPHQACLPAQHACPRRVLARGACLPTARRPCTACWYMGPVSPRRGAPAQLLWHDALARAPRWRAIALGDEGARAAGGPRAGRPREAPSRRRGVGCLHMRGPRQGGPPVARIHHTLKPKP